MVKYSSVEDARPLSGLRLAVTAHVPGIWSEAAKGLVAVWNDERPRSSWLELIYLAERLAPDPALIPADLDDRLLMFGLTNELAGDNGFGWNMRLISLHNAMGKTDAT